MHYLSLCFYSILEFVSFGGLFVTSSEPFFEQGSELGGKDGKDTGEPVMVDSLMVGQRSLS